MNQTAFKSPANTNILRVGGLLLLAMGLSGALIAGNEMLYRIQGGVSDLAGWLPFGYAFGAGMVAAVNPCGILLLPSLVAYYLGGDADERISGAERAGKAVLFGIMATLGFVVLFSSVGLVFAAGGRALGAYFPIGGLGIGVGLAGLGLWMIITGRSLGLTSASQALGRVHLRDGLGSLFLFGLAYGIASLACTLPVFMVVVGTTLTVSGYAQAAAQFVSYALGMGSMLTTVIVGAAFFRSAVTRSLRGVVPHLQGIAAALLVSAGLYIVYYWQQVLR